MSSAIGMVAKPGGEAEWCTGSVSGVRGLGRGAEARKGAEEHSKGGCRSDGTRAMDGAGGDAERAGVAVNTARMALAQCDGRMPPTFVAPTPTSTTLGPSRPTLMPSLPSVPLVAPVAHPPVKADAPSITALRRHVSADTPIGGPGAPRSLPCIYRDPAPPTASAYPGGPRRPLVQLGVVADPAGLAQRGVAARCVPRRLVREAGDKRLCDGKMRLGAHMPPGVKNTGRGPSGGHGAGGRVMWEVSAGG